MTEVVYTLTGTPVSWQKRHERFKTGPADTSRKRRRAIGHRDSVAARRRTIEERIRAKMQTMGELVKPAGL